MTHFALATDSLPLANFCPLFPKPRISPFVHSLSAPESFSCFSLMRLVHSSVRRFRRALALPPGNYIKQPIRLQIFVETEFMLFALETKGSAFKPLLNKPPISWRLKKFKEHHLGRRPSRTESEATLVGSFVDREKTLLRGEAHLARPAAKSLLGE